MVDHLDTLETELTAESSESALLSDLVARGKLDEAGTNRALAVARGGEERVSVVLSRLGLVSEAEIAETWSRLLSLPLSNILQYEMPKETTKEYLKYHKR